MGDAELPAQHIFVHQEREYVKLVVQSGGLRAGRRNGVADPRLPKPNNQALLSLRTVVVLLAAILTTTAAAGGTYVVTKQPAEAVLAGCTVCASATVWLNKIITG
jgi:hypothetical protein